MSTSTNPTSGPSPSTSASGSSNVQQSLQSGLSTPATTSTATAPNPLAGLSPEQLSAIFAQFAAAHNAVASQPQAPMPRNTNPSRSNKASTLIAMASSLPKLRGDSYSLWSTAIMTAVRSSGLSAYMDGSITPPSTDDAGNFDLYIQESGAIRTVIIGTLDPETSHRYLDEAETPKQIWDALKQRYQISDMAALRVIDERLVNLRLHEGGDLPEHLAVFKKLLRDLQGTKFEVTKERAIEWLYKSLPPSYENFITLQQQTEESDFTRLCIKLESHYHSVQSRSGTSSLALAATTRPNAPSLHDYCVPPHLRSLKLTGTKNQALANLANDLCKDCLGRGHIASQCPRVPYRLELWGPRQDRQNRQQDRSRPFKGKKAQANVAEAKEDSADVDANVSTVMDSTFPEYCAYVGTETVHVSGEVLAMSANNGHRAWLMDSGCQRHITYLRSIFVAGSLERLSTPVRITGIGETGVLAHYKGRIALPTSHGDDLYWWYIDDVLYAPEVGRNLLSMGALWESGKVVELTETGAIIYADRRRDWVEARVTLRDRLYILDVDGSIWTHQAGPQANVATTGVLWHKRLGHVQPSVLQQMANAGQIDNMSKRDLEEIAQCGSCAIGKGACLPFSASSSSTSVPLQVVHSDLCGPLDASVGGSRYVLSLIDDFSRMAWICVLKTKDQVFEAFKRWRAYIELSSGHRVKTLRTDGGGEYISNSMAAHLADAGILHQTTCPNSSQQNGVAERFFRTLLDRVRCMLAEAKMPWGWWAEAAMTAVHIYNRVPHSHLPGSDAPLSVWLDKPISVRNIRVFGSTCYAIDTSKHRKKSAPRATECRFLGCDLTTKGYRLQVLGLTKVIKTCDVIFHEDGSLMSAPKSPELAVPPPNQVSESKEGVLPPALSDAVSVGDPQGSVGELNGTDDNTPTGKTVQPRPKRNIKKTWKLREAETNVATVPKSYKEAMQTPKANGWSEAIKSEFASWKSKDVYEVVERPQDEQVIPVMVLFNRKTDTDGVKVRKKARCVVVGSQQTPPAQGSEQTTSSSPVASAASCRLMAAVAASTDCEFQQMDVNTAYLHAKLAQLVYVAIPPGFPLSELIPGKPRSEQVLKLNKAVYGLREAPHCWYAHCSDKFIDEDFTRSSHEHCLFTICAPNSTDPCHVLIYVDDFTLLTRTSDQMTWLKTRLSGMFDIKDLGAADQILGMEVTRDRTAKTLKLTQRKFLRSLLEEHGMLDCRPMDTPMLANALKTLPSHEEALDDKATEFMRDKNYRRLLGCLNWLAQGTRPDIAYSVSRLGQAQSNPHPAHWNALKHILRYLSRTLDMGLVYSGAKSGLKAHMYTDSSFADCPFTRKSHSGFVTIMAGAAVSHSSKKQGLVTTSSTEAEYVGMGHAAKEGVWITRMLSDLGVPLQEPITIFADNQSSMLLSDSEKLSSRTKHVDVQYHFVKEYVAQGKCRFEWVPTKLNTADVLTKPLGPIAFKEMPAMLGLPWKPRAYTPRPESETSDGSPDDSSGSVE
ncbi:Pol polyprotein/retrotransposon [Ceratobasidium sp. AG-Ba]|nr:Pol polyprotein/retrotransposon [Ceratobasidium sp. AG-Ba]